MRVRHLAAVVAVWPLMHGAAQADQSAVSAYIEHAFGALPKTDCSGKPGANVCSVPVTLVANTLRQAGRSTFESPPSGAVRYCSATIHYLADPLFGLVALGRQTRSETSPPFADQGLTCELDFDLNDNTLKFVGPKKGNSAPSITYGLQVLNGMLVGTANGFTAVVVFGTPSVVRASRH